MRPGGTRCRSRVNADLSLRECALACSLRFCLSQSRRALSSSHWRFLRSLSRSFSLSLGRTCFPAVEDKTRIGSRCRKQFQTLSCRTDFCVYIFNHNPHLLQQSDCGDAFCLFSSPPFCGVICLSLLFAVEAWLLVIRLPLLWRNMNKTIWV